MTAVYFSFNGPNFQERHLLRQHASPLEQPERQPRSVPETKEQSLESVPTPEALHRSIREESEKRLQEAEHAANRLSQSLARTEEDLRRLHERLAPVWEPDNQLGQTFS